MGRAVPGRKPVVLVVEDENLIRLSALDMVEEAGFEAIAASDARRPAVPNNARQPEAVPMKPSVFWKAGMTFARSSRMFTCPAPWVALIVTSGRNRHRSFLISFSPDTPSHGSK
jgi:hypothetical protein